MGTWPVWLLMSTYCEQRKKKTRLIFHTKNITAFAIGQWRLSEWVQSLYYNNIYIFMTGMWDACLFDYVLFCLFLSRTSKLIGIRFFACNLVQYKNSPDCTFKKIQIFFCHDSGDIIFCTDFLQSLPWVDVDQRPVPKWRIFLITPGPFHQPLQHIKS